MIKKIDKKLFLDSVRILKSLNKIIPKINRILKTYNLDPLEPINEEKIKFLIEKC